MRFANVFPKNWLKLLKWYQNDLRNDLIDCKYNNNDLSSNEIAKKANALPT